MNNRVRKIFFFFIGLFYSCIADSQAALPDSLKTDSLKKILQTQKEDTNKVNTLNELSAELVANRDISMEYAKSALLLSQKIHYKNGEANADYNYAIAFQGSNYIGTQGSLDEVLNYLNRALSLFQSLKNDSKIGDCYSKLSRAYMQLDQDIPAAIKNMLAALNIYEKTGDKQKLAFCYMDLGSYYLDEDDESSRKEGLEFLKKALNISIEIKDSSRIAYTAHLIGETSIYNRDYQGAFQYLNTSLETYQAMGSRAPDFGVSWTKGSIADLYVAQGNDAIGANDLKLASEKFQTALEIYRERVEVENAGNMSHRQSYGELGDCYFSLSKISSGKAKRDNLLQSLKYNELLLQIAVNANNKSIIGDSYYNLSEVYEALGNDKEAFENYKSYIIYRDSLYNEENTRKTVQAKMQYDFDKKTSIAKAEQGKKDAETRRIKNQQYFAIAGLGVVVLAVVVIALIQFRNNKQKIKANRLLQQQKEKVESTLVELKSTQTQLIQSEKMASLGELTAGIAHEIQNPLNFVNNFSEVNSELITEMREELAKGNIEEANQIAGDINENEHKIIFHGKRADAIVKGMLQHSRSSSGVKEPTDINALVDEYLRLAYHGLRAKDKTFNATMKTDYDQTIGKINIVPQDIGRAILNLITNAFYAVGERSKMKNEKYEPTVTVSTALIPPLGGRGPKIEIKVADNGGGIPQKVLDKIFQPFFTTKPTGQGTGLGLSLSYDIVKAHGGELKVDTKEGEFAVFTIILSA